MLKTSIIELPQAPVPILERLLAIVDDETIPSDSVNEMSAISPLITPEGRDMTLVVSRDFYEFQDYDEMDAVEDEFRLTYEALLAQVEAVWGPPTFQGNWQDKAFPSWAAIEAFLFAYWLRKEHSAAYIGVLKHDKETPFFLAVGACDTSIDWAATEGEMLAGTQPGRNDAGKSVITPVTNKKSGYRAKGRRRSL